MHHPPRSCLRSHCRRLECLRPRRGPLHHKWPWLLRCSPTSGPGAFRRRNAPTLARAFHRVRDSPSSLSNKRLCSRCRNHSPSLLREVREASRARFRRRNFHSFPGSRGSPLLQPRPQWRPRLVPWHHRHSRMIRWRLVPIACR